MNKAILALPTLLALTVAPVALAQQAAGSPPPPSAAAPPPAQPATTPPPATPPPATTPPPADPASTPAVTTTTSSDVTTVPASSTARPSERDTITLTQSVRPNRPLLYTGAVLFLGTYATTAALTAANTENGGGDKTMYMPVVGPWLHLADIDESGTDKALIIGSGVLQGIGVGLAAAGLFIPEKIPAATIQAGGATVHFTPASYGRGATGLAAVGRF